MEPAWTLILKVRDTKGYQGTILECDAFKPVERLFSFHRSKQNPHWAISIRDQVKQWKNSPFAKSRTFDD